MSCAAATAVCVLPLSLWASRGGGTNPLSTSMLISSYLVRVMSPAPASCDAGRPADVDDRDDLHDRGPGEVRGAQHFQRNILVLLPRQPGHLQRHHRLFLASEGFPRARRALLFFNQQRLRLQLLLRWKNWGRLTSDGTMVAVVWISPPSKSNDRGLLVVQRKLLMRVR